MWISCCQDGTWKQLDSENTHFWMEVRVSRSHRGAPWLGKHIHREGFQVFKMGPEAKLIVKTHTSGLARSYLNAPWLGKHILRKGFQVFKMGLERDLIVKTDTSEDISGLQDKTWTPPEARICVNLHHSTPISGFHDFGDLKFLKPDTEPEMGETRGQRAGRLAEPFRILVRASPQSPPSAKHNKG